MDSLGTLAFFGIPLKNEVDIGHLLTALTLLVGFTWWLYTTIRAMRRATRIEAESGSLRLLLRILRDRRGQPVAMEDLQREYNAPGLRDKRKAYCKRDFLLRTQAEFERAIYQLDWEGKIDFIGAQSVAFRVDKAPEDLQEEERRQRRAREQFESTVADRASAIETLRTCVWDKNQDTWSIRDLARTGMRVDAPQTIALVRAAMSDPDPEIQKRGAILLGELNAT